MHIFCAKILVMDGWIDGWMDGWMDGWVDGWVEAKARLRIAYSNKKLRGHFELVKIKKT